MRLWQNKNIQITQIIAKMTAKFCLNPNMKAFWLACKTQPGKRPKKEVLPVARRRLSLHGVQQTLYTFIIRLAAFVFRLHMLEINIAPIAELYGKRALFISKPADAANFTVLIDFNKSCQG